METTQYVVPFCGTQPQVLDWRNFRVENRRYCIAAYAAKTATVTVAAGASPAAELWIPSSLYPCAFNTNGEGDEVQIGEILQRVTQAWPPGGPRTADGAGLEINDSWPTECSP